MADLLPIGSVVSFADSPQKYMIYGRLKQAAESGYVYDYVACPHPWGQTSEEQDVVFDDERIDRLYLTGYQDIEELAFRADIERQYDAIKSGSIYTR